MIIFIFPCCKLGGGLGIFCPCYKHWNILTNKIPNRNSFQFPVVQITPRQVADPNHHLDCIFPRIHGCKMQCRIHLPVNSQCITPSIYQDNRSASLVNWLPKINHPLHCLYLVLHCCIHQRSVAGNLEEEKFDISSSILWYTVHWCFLSSGKELL